MLKITYSDSNVLVEQLAIAVEVMVAQRSVVALRAGQPLVLQPGYGSLTFPAHLPGVESLTYLSHSRGLVEVAPCDTDWLEVTLRGTWMADSFASEEGILMAELGDTLERQLLSLWRLGLGRVEEDCPQSSSPSSRR
jgi:hypothetical protein